MGSCFPELPLWNLNFRDTKCSSDGAKYTPFLIHRTAYLRTILGSKDKWIVPAKSNLEMRALVAVYPGSSWPKLICLHHSTSSKACSSGLSHGPQELGAAVTFLRWARHEKATETENTLTLQACCAWLLYRHILCRYFFKAEWGSY